MKNLFCYGFIISLLSGCYKYDNVVEASKLQVPPYTETGANTFGCFVNGKPWANFGKIYISNELSKTLEVNKVLAQRSYYDSTLYISANLSVLKKGNAIRAQHMSFGLPYSDNMKGIHRLTKKDYLFSFDDFITFNNRFVSLTRNPFTVTIYKDSLTVEGRIISGMFNGTLYNTLQTDSVKITGGVFDTLFH